MQSKLIRDIENMIRKKENQLETLHWPALIEAILKQSSYSETQLAREVGMTKLAIKRLRQGLVKDVRYQEGARLMSLYLSLQHKK